MQDCVDFVRLFNVLREPFQHRNSAVNCVTRPDDPEANGLTSCGVGSAIGAEGGQAGPWINTLSFPAECELGLCKIATAQFHTG